MVTTERINKQIKLDPGQVVIWEMNRDTFTGEVLTVRQSKQVTNLSFVEARVTAAPYDEVVGRVLEFPHFLIVEAQ